MRVANFHKLNGPDMQDLARMINTLRRPRLLIRAAKLGKQDYTRERHLRRLLPQSPLPRPAEAVLHLIEIERDLDDQRRDSSAGYSLPRHLDVLIALLAEYETYAMAANKRLTARKA